MSLLLGHGIQQRLPAHRRPPQEIVIPRMVGCWGKEEDGSVDPPTYQKQGHGAPSSVLGTHFRPGPPSPAPILG